MGLFESRLLRRMFGLGRKLHNEELYNLFSSPNIVRVNSRMRWVGHITQMGESEVHRIFVR
jgi:hypothetical protein